MLNCSAAGKRKTGYTEEAHSIKVYLQKKVVISCGLKTNNARQWKDKTIYFKVARGKPSCVAVRQNI